MRHFCQDPLREDKLVALSRIERPFQRVPEASYSIVFLEHPPLLRGHYGQHLCCGTYQFVGLTLVIVKKQAVVGSPMSTMFSFCASKNWAGGSSGIGGTLGDNALRRSGRAFFIVAARLCGNISTYQTPAIHTFLLRHPTSMVQLAGTDPWFLPSHALICLVLGFREAAAICGCH